MKENDDDPDIERWLNEGGMQLSAASAVFDPALLHNSEGRVIVCLGVGLLSAWDEIPSHIRKLALQMAMTSSNYDVALLKQRTARFLRGRSGTQNVPDDGVTGPR
ncbi:hypothetical protein [Bordetella genomosp. 11]|uniref:Uncharacterized protein n=1 Tax=Bordetella genomosp. 11 TaxID=1416808 RepID=A0A261UJP7_9BORD|nr:hypothetical protein [Bordetella genomosp. 11]OZI62139.1 hypothetical protein CAL28_23235 [Bordetella genomosp. 11]